MRTLAVVIGAAGLAGLAVTGCEPGGGTGYVEIRTVPVSPTIPQTFVLDSEKLDPVKKGQAVLRTKVGAHKLLIEGSGGAAAFLCDLVVKKDRITTVTVSLLDRPPRCQCRNSPGVDGPAGRACIS
jgi:hypothetical protein